MRLNLNNEPDESHISCDMEGVALFADNIIDFNGQKFTPDDTKGYFTFALSHAFPAGVTAWGTGLHPSVIGLSYQSLLNQNINYEHQIKQYHKKGVGHEPSVEDRVVGCVAAVDFPRSPTGGWKITSKTGGDIPAIRGVGVFFKQTTGMSKLIGDHSTGRHKYTVSMEVQYPFTTAGFAIARRGLKSDKSFDTTPQDFRDAGFDYVPFDSADEEVRATFSKEKNRITGKYKGRDTFLLMGGLSSPVHYCGVGIVKYGAERTANIGRMAAGAPESIAAPFFDLAALLEQAAASLISKK